MTFEQTSNNGVSTEYIPASKFPETEPLTSPFTQIESSKTGSVSDTASGGSDHADDPALGVSAENYNQSLFGQKRPWGLDPFDRSYPAELDFTAGVPGNEFDKSLNAVAGDGVKGEKLTTVQQAEAEAEPQLDVQGKGKAGEKITEESEFDEKFNLVPKKGTETITDPFDPMFNIVPKKMDSEKPAAEIETDEEIGDKKPPTDGKAPPATPGSSNGFFTKAFNGITDSLTGAVDEAAKLPERVAKDGADTLSTIGTALGFGPDLEAARIVGNAEKGKKHADSQDEQYVKQLKGLAENGGKIAPPKEGDDPAKYTVQNADKSSYTVTNGKISDFQTAPTKDRPEGVKYSDIKYDAKNQIESYKNGNGQTHTRISAPDANGFASWKSTDTATGKPSNYTESSIWRGKPVIDTNGMHNLIGSGTFNGQMFSRHLDGSQVATKPEFNTRGQRTGLETTTTLPDNTKVTQKGHFNGATQKLEHADTVKVKEGDGPKTSQVKFEAGRDKGDLVPPPKVEKSAAGDSMIGMFKDILAPESLTKMKDIKELNIQRNGPHSFHIDGNMNNVFMEPPNVSVGGFGPLGRVSATPQGGFVNKFDMNLHIGQNRVDIDHVHGIHGSASLDRHKRNGSVKHIGSTPTSTIGATWDMNSNTITARSSGGQATALDARNFAKDSLTGKLLSNEKSEKAAQELLQGLDKKIDGASFKQVKPLVFETSIELKQKQIPLDAKIPGVKANLYVDDKVNFTRSLEGVTFKPGEAQLGVQVGKGLEDRKDIAKISSVTNEKGAQSMKIEFHGKHDPMTIPMDAPGKGAAKLPGGDKTAEPSKPDTGKQVRGTDTVTPPMVRPEIKQPEHPAHEKVQPTEKNPVRNVRDAVPQRVETAKPVQHTNNNYQNNCNEGSHRRRLFGRRR